MQGLLLCLTEAVVGLPQHRFKGGVAGGVGHKRQAAGVGQGERGVQEAQQRGMPLDGRQARSRRTVGALPR